MSRRSFFPLLAVVVALVLLLLDRRGPGDSGDALAPAQERATPIDGAADLDAPHARPRVGSATRVDALGSGAAAPASVGSAVDTKVASWTAQGLVVDMDGQPCAGLTVIVLPEGSHELPHTEWAAAAERASRTSESHRPHRTGIDGRFAVEVETAIALVFVHDPNWTTLFAGYAGAHAAAEDILVVVAPAVRCAGHVVDDVDLPVSGAKLWIHDELAPSLPGFPLPLTRSMRVAWSWSTDRTGAFDLRGFAPVLRRRIIVDCDGYNRTTFWPLAEDRLDWLVVMQRTPEPPPGGYAFLSEPLLFGFVRDTNGAPIEAARVMLCEQSATTDSAGRFEFERPGHVPDGVALVARAPDGRVAVERDKSRWEGGGARIGPIELCASHELRALPCRVVDVRGAPLPGWRVALVDPTVVDAGRLPPLSVELGLDSGAEWPLTDADGRVTLRSLPARDYRAVAFDPSSLVHVFASVAPDQREIVFVVPDSQCLAELRGIVLDADGRPVRGVEVALSSSLERHRIAASSGPGRRATSDAGGCFRLTRVPRGDASLMFFGASIETQGVMLTDSQLDAAFVEVRVDRVLLVQVDARGADPLPVAVQFQDESERIVFASHPGGGHARHSTIELHEGRSSVIAVDPRARFALLLVPGAISARVLIEPTDQVTIVRSP